MGFTVPESILKRALDNLHKRLLAGAPLFGQERYSESPTHLSFAGNAYAQDSTSPLPSQPAAAAYSSPSVRKRCVSSCA